MTAPGPAQPAPGAPTPPTPGAPGTGSQVNPPAPQQPAPQPPPQQQPPQQQPPQQQPPQLPAPQQPAALPAGQAPPALPVPAAQAPAAPGAPASAPPRAKPAKAASGGGGGYLVAVFALIIAVAAAGAAAYSLKLSMELRDENAAEPLVEATPTTEAATGTAAPTGTAVPTETVPAGPEYVAELVRVELLVPDPTGCTAAYVDVDTGNVGVENGHEFYLSRCQDPSTLQVRLDRTSGRSTSGADPSAQECAALVAGTPTSELVLRAEEGLTFCLLTNQAQASAASLPQRLAIVEVLPATTSQVRLALSTFRVED